MFHLTRLVAPHIGKKTHMYHGTVKRAPSPFPNLVHCVFTSDDLFQCWTVSTAMSDASAPGEDEDCHPR